LDKLHNRENKKKKKKFIARPRCHHIENTTLKIESTE